MTASVPKSIHSLPQEVINKISAGEVIHRPVNVVKELLENSIDAGATQVSVTLKAGGMSQIIIQDNGTGIRKDDLSIVCNRFTTSKLCNFEDLQTLSTFGFRGEALASVSTVSHLSIQSKTADSVCGYRAEYVEGDLKPGHGLKPVAMNQGTSITVEDLFFNIPERKKALSSENTEFGLVMDMMERYALLHSGKAGLSLKKSSAAGLPAVNTKSSSTLEENIGLLFGEQIAKKLLNVCINDDRLGFEAKLHFTSSDLNLKRMYFILFINNRLVDSNSLKRSLKDLYTKYLMKGGNPFVLIFLSVDPKNIDVNVHPTKSEVCFLYEDEILERICQCIEKRLTNRDSSNVCNEAISQKTSISKTLLQAVQQVPSTSRVNKSPVSNSDTTPSLHQTTLPFGARNNTSISSQNTSLNKSKNRPQKKQIRTDAEVSRIDQYLKSKSVNSKAKRREFSYDSLRQLRKEVYNARDEDILSMFKNSTFVGSIDESRLLLQYELNLVMINASNINLELFYQLYLVDFGNFSVIQFQEPLCLRRLLQLYFRHTCPDSTDSERHIQRMVDSLCEKADMLDDYFSLKIDTEKKCLVGIPRLIDDHSPYFGFLPDFLYHLMADVNFDDELECFQQVGLQIAKFYTKNDPTNDWKELHEHRFYPLYKSLLLPSKDLLSNETIITLTNTTNLYKVFERC